MLGLLMELPAMLAHRSLQYEHFHRHVNGWRQYAVVFLAPDSKLLENGGFQIKIIVND